MHNMQDSTFTVLINISRFVVKKFTTTLSISKKEVKCLSVFLSRSFQDISCLYKVIIFIAKRNYFVDFMLTVKFILAYGFFNASREFAREDRESNSD